MSAFPYREIAEKKGNAGGGIPPNEVSVAQKIRRFSRAFESLNDHSSRYGKKMRGEGFEPTNPLRDRMS